MASPDLPLDRLQRWMQDIVVDAAPAADVEQVILPSRTLTAAERILIYHRMYPLRMQEALSSDYPGLQHFLGDEAFDALVRRYVEAHPSRSYTLNRLGDHLPDFVAHAPDLPRRTFCAELARLEHAIALVFDAPEGPTLDGAAVAAMGDAVIELRLKPVEAFRLLRFRYPVGAYLDSVRDENHDHPRTSLKSTWIAVYRRGYVVQRMELQKEQHLLLETLQAGATLGDAVEKTLGSARRTLAPDEFFSWFRRWVAAGIFRAIDSDTLGSGL